jgi:hypothetical protein
MDPLIPLSPVPVRCKGERERTGGLTLGQLNILQWMKSAPEPFDAAIGGPLDIPEGTRIADVAESLATLMARHEGLRTTIVDEQPPYQHVAGDAELWLDVYEIDLSAPESADRSALVPALGRMWSFDPEFGFSRLPLWGALATVSDVVHAAVVRCSHLTVDFQALQILTREFGQLLRDPAARQPGAPRHQPLDQVELEDSERMRRRAGRALRHAESNLARMQPCLYPAPQAEVAGRSVSVEICSDAAAIALRRIAARTGRSRSSVVLAAICALLSWRVGFRELVFPTLASNRFEGHLAGYLGSLVQTTLAAVEVGAASFDELVGRSWRAVLHASRHGMYDASRRDAIAKQVEHDRGVRFSFEPLFNSPAVDLQNPAGDMPPVVALTAAARPTFQREEIRATAQPIRFDVFSFEPAMRLRLWSGDTSRLGVEEMESLLRAVERLLVAAAHGDLQHEQIGAALAVEPIHYGPEWLMIDSCRVELPEVQRLLDNALAPAASRIFPEVAGRQLVAYVVAGGAVRSPAEAHARCMAALAGRPTAMAPRHYVLWEVAPEDPDDRDGWRQMVGEGSGRTRLA